MGKKNLFYGEDGLQCGAEQLGDSRTRFQTAPLDLETNNFYLVRRDPVEPRFQWIHAGRHEGILITSWESHKGTAFRLQKLVKRDDLLLWCFCGEYSGEAKLVEVICPNPNDRLSKQQSAWLLVLMDCGFDAEVCKISPSKV
ncbi:hypothetical protein MLD38_032994 [Melastoma candidum]|uniref:Uncharacterized protein n=1 Tax=Melastoma candidum TaxID=119954 RepID=A0ACB9M541_9MYRT|nr:hypothetical protein MLD38_032994 [Melastoma candidum]